MTDSTTIGQEILEFRARHNLSQREFARLAHLSPTTVLRLEGEKTGCKKVVQARIRIFMREYKG